MIEADDQECRSCVFSGCSAGTKGCFGAITCNGKIKRHCEARRLPQSAGQRRAAVTANGTSSLTCSKSQAYQGLASWAGILLHRCLALPCTRENQGLVMKHSSWCKFPLEIRFVMCRTTLNPSRLPSALTVITADSVRDMMPWRPHLH